MVRVTRVVHAHVRELGAVGGGVRVCLGPARAEHGRERLERLRFFLPRRAMEQGRLGESGFDRRRRGRRLGVDPVLGEVRTESLVRLRGDRPPLGGRGGGGDALGGAVDDARGHRSLGRILFGYRPDPGSLPAAESAPAADGGRVP